ncbi:DCC1-like thiol-disulfide oxidoreductase family protein [Pantoea sp. Mb-10]|uniref:thiol-disulfide oxidoreductase DCC family protein n=1 Tax=unclassified Pantoea TaxID=2630326 RepID=UPI001E3EEB7C|nr:MULTISPECIES: DCC1-like thiol-disulfide oxidoreductase family protein [unclassified Pantoea]MCE0491875.1 DCC1-like thiol-disulfide oxidoreductase family protein [Pantoea sp. Mb-10]MCE0503387.1 DCC1-like thiol-disulfide oxidoreductase family protein [Pantoea sp. Pb-8]
MASLPFMHAGEHVILYDGVCKLCNAWVRFLLRRSLSPRIRFAAIQSEKGQALLRAVGLPGETLHTLVLINSNGHWLRAQAVCRAMAHMPWPWRAFAVLRLLPDRLTTKMYDLIARNRYRLFGQYDCVHPLEADYPDRFL